MYLNWIAWTVLLAPLSTVIITGFTKHLTRQFVQTLAILNAAISFLCTLCIAWKIFFQGEGPWHIQGLTWLALNNIIQFNITLCIDRLSTVMSIIVTTITLLVHLYSVDYMRNDASYQRFFSYLSFFTFAMLMLVCADNFLPFFFGWEGVGFASYLLIGFWFQKPVAQLSNLKAFLINRAGDIGLLLGISLLFTHVNSLSYLAIFDHVAYLAQIEITVFKQPICVVTLATSLLLISVMTKSAQIPFQTWLPDSMVGPTPVSALMHAATMVAAGIYLIVRLSLLFEYCQNVRLFMLFIGATTALLLGLVALTQQDAKRIIAFSTISQLGYMMAGLGASAYHAAFFHLTTHAFFKALLFLSLGVVTFCAEHEQNIYNIGARRWRYTRIAYGCFILGSLCLIGIPPFSGFYSKEMILEAVYFVYQKHRYIGFYALFCLLTSVFITALYIGRLFFHLFHGHNTANKTQTHISVDTNITWMNSTLLVLGIITLFIGKMLFPYVVHHLWLKDSHVYVNITLYHYSFLITVLPSLLGVFGILMAWLFFTLPAPSIFKPQSLLHRLLISQYGLEYFNHKTTVSLVKWLAQQCNIIDIALDQWVLQRFIYLIRQCTFLLRKIQSGYLYHYLQMMVVSIVFILIKFVIYV